MTDYPEEWHEPEEMYKHTVEAVIKVNFTVISGRYTDADEISTDVLKWEILKLATPGKYPDIEIEVESVESAEVTDMELII